MSSRKRIIMDEIRTKAAALPEESIEVANGEHTLFRHIAVGQDELRRRARKSGHEQSSFFSKDAFIDCFRDFFSDEYGLGQVADWILGSNREARFNAEGGIFDKTVGLVAMPDGEVYESGDYVLVLQKQDSYYRNKLTGLPFDIVTAYLEY